MFQVTYKWLSKKLGVHVNVSKQLLWEFWQGYERKVDMTVVFVIIGLLKGGTIHIEVVKESNMSSAEEKFDKINCKHIYSLQRALSNLQSLVLSNETNVLFSAIRCRESFIKLRQDLPFLQQTNKIQEEKQQNIQKKRRLLEDTAKKDSSKLLKQDVSQIENSMSKNKKIENASKNDLSKKVKNVTDIFSKKPVQGQQAEFQNHFSKAVTANVGFESRESKGIKGKNNSLNAVKDINSSESGILMVEKNVMPQEKVCNDEIKIKNEDSDQVISTKKGQNEEKNNENCITVKKRKRILSVSNSDEEESVSSEFAEEKKIADRSFQSELKLNISESVYQIKDKVCMAGERDEIWVDEDGFLVTKKDSLLVKEKVENPNDKLPIQESQKEKHVNKKQTKQTTLVSFFKKS